MKSSKAKTMKGRPWFVLTTKLQSESSRKKEKAARKAARKGGVAIEEATEDVTDAPSVNRVQPKKTSRSKRKKK